MEVDIIAIYHCYRSLFPVIYIDTSLGKSFGIPMDDTTMNFYVNNYNVGALIFARTLSPQFTPRSKYYATNNICFREDIVKRSINIFKTDTVDRIGDLFKRGMLINNFEYLHKKIMGW